MEQTIAAQYTTPTGRVPVLLQFNKVSGALMMVLTAQDASTLNQEFFVYKEAEFDFQDDVVVGTVDDFKIVSRSELPDPIYEDQLDSLARDKITKVYPVIQQVNLVGKAVIALDAHLLAIGKQLDAITREIAPELAPLALTSVVESVKEMNNYIAEVKQANALRKEYYQESVAHEYISSEEAQARLDATLEGGIHEAYGARASEGGRVF